MFYRNRQLYSCIIVLFLLSFVCNGLYALEPYTVRTVYFIPTDSEDKSDWLNLDDIMKSNQNVYRNEMDRHGFPDKTFRLELDNQGNVVVHKVNGKHDKAHYSGNTLDLVRQELLQRFNDKKNIYAVVMAGMPSLQWGHAAGVAGMHPGGWWNRGEDHGFAVSCETSRHTTEQVILHELGHTFGLWHIVLYDPAEFILGSGKKLSLHEARWLSKSCYFNNVWNFGFAPSILKFRDAQLFGDDDNIRFRVDITDSNGLHQAYAWLNTNIVGWDFFDGDKHDTAVFDIDRRHLANDKTIWIQLMDSHGNWLWYPESYKLPDIKKLQDLDQPDLTNKNPDINTNKNPDINTNDDDLADNCIHCNIDNNEPDLSENNQRPVDAKSKLSTSWAKIKSSRY